MKSVFHFPSKKEEMIKSLLEGLDDEEAKNYLVDCPILTSLIHRDVTWATSNEGLELGTTTNELEVRLNQEMSTS